MNNSNLIKLLSNYGSKIWAMFSVFIFIPVYIHYLGIENYAVIGFYTLLLGIISFADAGMSSAIIKEFAIISTPAYYKYSVLRRLENLYLPICFLLMFFIFIFSDLIANKWLSSEGIKTNVLSHYVSLIGCGVTMQLLSSLYFGALFGLNEQVRANFFQIIWNSFKAGFVIIIIAYYSSSIEVFLIWQIICNVVYVLFLRYKTIKTIRESGGVLENELPGIPAHVLKYIGGMTAIAIISSINSQADKIISSSFFSLKVFGYYNMGSVISQIPVIVGSPLVLFVFPLFSKFSLSGFEDKLIVCFKKVSFLLNIIIFPSTFLLVLYTSEIMKLWTGNTIEADIFSSLLIVIKFLSIGSLFLALQFPLFYLLLSKGKTKYTIYQGIVQIFFGLPFLYLCVKCFGLKGIGVPWIVINLGSLIFLTLIVFKKYLLIDYLDFFKEIIFIPFTITLAVCGLLYVLYLQFNSFFYIFLLFSGLVSLLLNLFYFNYTKAKLFYNISNFYDFPN